MIDFQKPTVFEFVSCRIREAYCQLLHPSVWEMQWFDCFNNVSLIDDDDDGKSTKLGGWNGEGLMCQQYGIMMEMSLKEQVE